MVSPAALDAFFEESVTHLEVIETTLLNLEKDSGNMEIIDELFRAVHSMKGNAGLVGFGDIHTIATEMETMMEDVRQKKSPVEQSQRDLMFNLLDKMRAFVGDAKPLSAGEGASDAEEKTPDPVKKELAQPAKTQQAGKAPVKKLSKKPGKEKKSAQQSMQAYLTFMLGDEEYGLDIKSVREIILKRHITRIPNALHFVTGIMNLRGLVIPVIDAKKKLNFSNLENSRAENVIVVDNNGIPTGVLVDVVKDIVKFDKDMIVPASRALGTMDSEYISGIGKLGKTTIMLLDVALFCDEKEKYF